MPNAVLPIRASLLAAALALGAQASAQAQALLDVIGAGAIQNTLQSLPAGGASGVIERSRSAEDQSSLAEQQRQQLLQQLSGGSGGGGGSAAPAAGLMAPLMQMLLAGGGGESQRASAQVNGQLVPYCSHGGLCHGALMQALRSR